MNSGVSNGQFFPGPRQTAVRFFEILEDTLIVYRCEPFARSAKRRLIQHPRFFYFDCGILNGILKNFEVSHDRAGILFEHLIFTQIVHSAMAQDVEIRISSYRSSGGAEVDFIVEKGKEVFAVEAKGSRNVGASNLRGFKSFREFYKKPFRPFVAYLGPTERKLNGVDSASLGQEIQKAHGDRPAVRRGTRAEPRASPRLRFDPISPGGRKGSGSVHKLKGSSGRLRAHAFPAPRPAWG